MSFIAWTKLYYAWQMAFSCFLSLVVVVLCIVWVRYVLVESSSSVSLSTRVSIAKWHDGWGGGQVNSQVSFNVTFHLMSVDKLKGIYEVVRPHPGFYT